uniref:DUF7595 domain-containing protein n=1 Tax=Oryza punctata TaxID=4537 RepID=A0A0E0M282_ORYPU
MPPLRRRRRRAPGAPYKKGWLSRRPRRKNADYGTSLTDDALSAIFARLVNAADLVRCAATSCRWGRIVARQAPPVLSHGRPASPTLALGFFHQDDAPATAQKRKLFVPMATAAARVLGFRWRSFSALFEAVGSDVLEPFLEHSRPIASRNGRVVLELAREGHGDDLKLCVCNPMTGDVSMLPPLSGKDKPGFYVCTLLTADDLLEPPCTTTFFRVLIVYNRPSFTALRSYSSETGRWSAEARRSVPKKINTRRMQQLRHAVVLRGVAYWTLRHTAFAVRSDTPEPVEVAMLARGLADLWPNNCVLGATPDGKLVFLYMVRCVDFVGVGGKGFHPPPAGPGDDMDMDMSKGEWQYRQIKINLEQLKVEDASAINVRWFCERSGIVLFTLGDELSSCPGTYALNLATHDVIKVSTAHSWTNFCGYEMDHAASLASVVA